jgi:hypothetical protein
LFSALILIVSEAVKGIIFLLCMGFTQGSVFPKKDPFKYCTVCALLLFTCHYWRAEKHLLSKHLQSPHLLFEGTEGYEPK